MMTRGRVENGMWESLEGGHFDLVVSNPPYIASNDIPGLDPEVRNFDPGLALDGGADGLDAYRSLGATLPRVLAPGGIAIVELGQGQAAAVGLIFREAGLLILGVQNDLAGVERVLIARKMPNSEGKSPPATLSSVSPLGAGQKSD